MLHTTTHQDIESKTMRYYLKPQILAHTIKNKDNECWHRDRERDSHSLLAGMPTSPDFFVK